MLKPIAQQVRSIHPRKTLPWILRTAIVVTLFYGTAHRRPYVILGPPQTVQTQHPITCVHTRLTDEVEEWKIQRTMEMVRQMGATTIVEFFPWPYIETQQGVYNWGHSDLIVRHARAQGLTVIARLGMVPEWAQPNDPGIDQATSLTHLSPDRFYDFGKFIGEFASHYKHDIQHIIVWNEPNLAYEWGYQDAPPQWYVSVLQFAYHEAHKANPTITVIAGALAPTLEPVGSQYGTNDLDYLRELYVWGMKDSFDALAVHTYGFRFPPEEPPDPAVLDFRRVELLRQIMVENGDSAKPVFITESGWNDHPRWTKAVRPAQRIAYTLDAFRFAETNWPWLSSLCVWNFRYPAPTYSFPDYFTLVSPDFVPKPIYDAIQAWARGWSQ